MDHVEFEDVESSESLISDEFYPHRTSVSASSGAEFRGRLTLHRLGPIVVGEIDFNAEVLLTCPSVVGAYHLNVPVEGAMQSRSLGKDSYLNPTTAATYRKGADALLTTNRPLHMFAVKFDSQQLESCLDGLLGQRTEGDLVLESELALGHGPGREWWDLLCSVRRQLERGDTIMQSPLVAEPLAQALMSGFLMAVSHQYSEGLRADSQSATPDSVRHAEDVILARLAEPISISDVAREIGLGVRAVQRGFLQHLGVTPSQYVRAERLRRAHADLITADPAATSVADIATRWGFTHLGRFAQQYRNTFGEMPSATLRT